MDITSIRKRMAELQEEMNQLFVADRIYKRKGKRRATRDIVDHENRVLRMRRVLDEIAKLKPSKSSPDL